MSYEIVVQPHGIEAWVLSDSGYRSLAGIYRSRADAEAACRNVEDHEGGRFAIDTAHEGAVED